MDRRLAPIASDAIDPKPTDAGLKSRIAAGSFSAFSLTCRHSAASPPPRRRIGRGGFGEFTAAPLEELFLVAGRLVATALLARDRATIVPFDRGGHHAATLPWTDGDAAWADANGDV